MNVESILSELKSERDLLDRAILALASINGSGARGRPRGKRKRMMSPEARAKIAAGARRRWAAARKAGKSSLAS